MLGSSSEVIAKLELEHNEIEYTIIRKQVYKKDVNGIVKPDNPTLEIFTKNWTEEAVLNYIKIGFSEIDEDDLFSEERQNCERLFSILLDYDE